MGEGKKLALLGLCVVCVYMLCRGEEERAQQPRPAPSEIVEQERTPNNRSRENTEASTVDTETIDAPASTTREWAETVGID